MVGKAEWLPGGPNPRFVVTSLPKDRFDARTLCEGLHCARGDMANRIKEQKLMMFPDRTSTRVMHPDRIRLHLSSFAYLLMQSLRGKVLCGTRMARARCGRPRCVPVSASRRRPGRVQPRGLLARGLRGREAR